MKLFQLAFLPLPGYPRVFSSAAGVLILEYSFIKILRNGESVSCDSTQITKHISIQ